MSRATDFLKFSTLLLILFAAVQTTRGAGGGCDHCGCKKVKKVTRLVKTCKQLDIPIYQCVQEEAFCPKKELVCHTRHYCDPNYKVHSCGCIKEHCVKHKSCEEVTHVVHKDSCKCNTKCETSIHHKEYYDYDVHFTNRITMSCCPESGCETVYGASPCGCFKNTCLQKPTDQRCRPVVPEVRWVTYRVCSECNHTWCDENIENIQPSPAVESNMDNGETSNETAFRSEARRRSSRRGRIGYVFSKKDKLGLAAPPVPSMISLERQ